MLTTKDAFQKFNSLDIKKKNTAFRVYNNGFAICHIMVYYKGLLIDAYVNAYYHKSKFKNKRYTKALTKFVILDS